MRKMLRALASSGLFDRTAKPQVIPVGIHHQEIAHPVIVVLGLSFGNGTLTSDLGEVGIHLITEEISRATSHGAVMDAVTGEMQARLPELHPGVVTKTKVLGEPEDFGVVFQSGIQIGNLENRRGNVGLHAI
jgi:hypothetical protein